MQHLFDEDHLQRLQLGPSRRHALTTDRRISKGAPRVYDSNDAGPVAGYVRFEWDTLDWFEEDTERKSSSRCRDFDNGIDRFAGGSGTPGPKAECGRPRL
jgi:hypothetical protein